MNDVSTFIVILFLWSLVFLYRVLYLLIRVLLPATSVRWLLFIAACLMGGSFIVIYTMTHWTIFYFSSHLW